MAKKKRSNMAAYALLGFLVLALGGFGATNFTGTVRNIGTVGDKDIRVDSYARAVQEELRAVQAQTGQTLTFEQAQQFGLSEGVIARLVNDRALDVEADRMGISIGDATLGQQIRDIPAFQSPDGAFDRETYRFALDRAGLSEETFEADLRDETTRTLLQAAVTSGIVMPQTYADTLADYVGERRSVTFARMGPSDLDAPLPTPDEETLRAYHQDNIADFTLPEQKRITHVWLTPDMLLGEVEVSEDDVTAQYEARLAEFQRPERRLVERLVFADQDAADAAMARIQSGDADFDDLVEGRGLDLADVDLGDVTQGALGAAGDVVFAAEGNSVVGPAPSDLGPALYRINGILEAEITDEATAREKIRSELALLSAERAVDAAMEPVEDLLAGGATLEEVAQDTPLRLETIDWFEGVSTGIAAEPGFDAAADALTAEDYPELMQLQGGALLAMRLDEVLPPAPQPFEEVRDRLETAWEASETDRLLTAKAEEMLPRLREGATFAGAGLSPTSEEITRRGAIAGTPNGFVDTIFEMAPGEIRVTSGFGAVLIVRLDGISGPDAEDATIAQMRENLRNQASASVARDLFANYSVLLRDNAGIRLDQEAINAVHANLQ
ncbi:SurA N-terminal domain-containing protein [Pseudooceanicola aestuarii]|uniref:SurA N-terminal domain-containing protein n=1 Tax=Pseudooceanicola aestuarii TaxID=2697319 RepID=UPI001EF7DC8E|nr:SurA N-terminal domain-containing protein [Pseudooceanicola aestuarii]